jgi:hypothetical protein
MPLSRMLPRVIMAVPNKLISLAGSPGTSVNRVLGPPHNSGQLPVVLLAVRPVGCPPLAAESGYRELLRIGAKLFWHVTEHTFWPILFFGMGVKLPARLVAIKESRIIAATLSFICTPLKSWDIKSLRLSLCKWQ